MPSSWARTRPTAKGEGIRKDPEEQKLDVLSAQVLSHSLLLESFGAESPEDHLYQLLSEFSESPHAKEFAGPLKAQCEEWVAFQVKQVRQQQKQFDEWKAANAVHLQESSVVAIRELQESLRYPPTL